MKHFSPTSERLPWILIFMIVTKYPSTLSSSHIPLLYITSKVEIAAERLSFAEGKKTIQRQSEGLNEGLCSEGALTATQRSFLDIHAQESFP